jgi:hypothetical protein
MNVYQTAIDAENACNLSGLAHTLAQMMPIIWDEARRLGEGTEYVNTHPAVVLMLNTMIGLATGDVLRPSALSIAWDQCRQRATEGQ